IKWLASQLNLQIERILLIAPYLTKPYEVEGECFPQWIRKENDYYHLLIDPKFKIGTEVEFYHESYLRASLPESVDFNDLFQKVGTVPILISEDDQIISSDKIKKHLSKDLRVQLIIENQFSHLGLLTGPEEVRKIKELMLGWI
ncbi:MAG: hypothetical protein KDD45_13110, partial [Bdellovibrionales bacterium]|nr:hypothetical protein [Bdellovibrionales bacterium]